MSKSILVLDNINHCIDCPMSYEKELLYLGGYKYLQLYSCKCLPEDVENIYIEDICKEKPDWCPLQDVPHKMAVENRWFSEEYAQGWNDCIDKNLKERD